MPIKEVFERLTTRDEKRFWTSGQWMTERKGGSDVGRGHTFTQTDTLTHTHLHSYTSLTPLLPGAVVTGCMFAIANGTETVAQRQEDGSYRLHGFKWFTSATDADITLTLARITDRHGNSTPVHTHTVACTHHHSNSISAND